MIFMRSSKNEIPSIKSENKYFSLSSLRIPNTLDTIITFLPKLEREILTLFVIKRSNLTAKHVERIIQSAYLFNAADFVIKEELKKGHKITKLLFKDAPFFSEFVYYFYAVARHPSEKIYYGIEPPKDIEISEDDTRLENLTKFFIAEEDATAESKRLKLVSEANKVVPKAFAIPSYKKINAALSYLLIENYIWYTSKGKKALLSINQDFLNVWEKRYEQLIEEAANEKIAKMGLNQERDIKKEISKLAKLSSSLLSFSLYDELKNFVLKKYGPIVYEFFFLNIAYSDNKESLLILKYKNEIATYTPY